MGILLVYDVTDEASFNNIRNWMKNIEQHASDNVVKVGWAAAEIGPGVLLAGALGEAEVVKRPALFVTGAAVHDDREQRVVAKSVHV